MKSLLLLVGMLVAPAFAATSANIAFSSDYAWRGMTQSDGPAMSGGFDFKAENGFYAGIWGSNVNFNDGAGSELDYYAGYAFSLGEIDVDLGYVAFDYPKNTTGLDFEEYVLGLSYGDFNLTLADDIDDSDLYTQISYALELINQQGSLGEMVFSYGDYQNYGENFVVTYSFSCGSFDCGLMYRDFTGETDSAGTYLYGPNEDGLIFSISASL